MKNIEVEIRSFISKEKYLELIDFFKANAKLIKRDLQETHYFDCEQDLRIQRNSFVSKICMKKGRVHDEAREEIEVKFDKHDFDVLKKLFEDLNYNTEIIWLRKRLQFLWDGVNVCLDNTKGYGYIIELDKMSGKRNKEKTLRELKQRLRRLNIALTPREKFEEKFEYYKKNWRKLIK